MLSQEAQGVGRLLPGRGEGRKGLFQESPLPTSHRGPLTPVGWPGLEGLSGDRSGPEQDQQAEGAHGISRLTWKTEAVGVRGWPGQRRDSGEPGHPVPADRGQLCTSKAKPPPNQLITVLLNVPGACPN